MALVSGLAGKAYKERKNLLAFPEKDDGEDCFYGTIQVGIRDVPPAVHYHPSKEIALTYSA